MMPLLLTRKRSDAKPLPMTKAAPLLILFLAITGCVQVQVPDKPIEINLNVNIKQEVVLSLKKDASALITENEDLFPK